MMTTGTTCRARCRFARSALRYKYRRARGTRGGLLELPLQQAHREVTPLNAGQGRTPNAKRRTLGSSSSTSTTSPRMERGTSTTTNGERGAHNPQQYHPGKTRDRPCSEPGFLPVYEQGGSTPGMRTRVSKPRDIPGKAHIPGFSWLLDHRYRRQATGRGDRPGIRPGMWACACARKSKSYSQPRFTIKA